MIDFLIMYEVRVRELESILLLGNELEHRGYSVEYISFDEVSHNKYIENRKLIKRYFNNVRTVLMPSLYHNTELYNTVYYVCGKCAHVVNLRWEQIFTNKKMRNTKAFPFPQGDALKAFHMCWGKLSYTGLLETGVTDDKLLLTGPLHMDLLRPEFLNYYLKPEELFAKYSINNTSKKVLYISSFAIATMTDRQFAREEVNSNGACSKDSYNVSFNKNSYELTLTWIESFLEVNKNIVFIYRPHPSENITDKLEVISKKYTNFKVISDYSVKQWITACDTVITWVSTSIVEAFFAGKACFILRPIPYNEDEDMCIFEDAKFVTDKEKFLHLEDTGCELSVKPEIIKNGYDVDSHKPSYLRLCDIIVSVVLNDSSFPWDEQKIRDFNSKRWSFVYSNIIFFFYSITLKCLLWFKSKIGISFGNYIDQRIENIRMISVKKTYDKANNESFNRIKKDIGRMLSKIREA
jgi:surface carbohydrate biosynthesis protein